MTSTRLINLALLEGVVQKWIVDGTEYDYLTNNKYGEAIFRNRYDGKLVEVYFTKDGYRVRPIGFDRKYASRPNLPQRSEPEPLPAEIAAAVEQAVADTVKAKKPRKPRTKRLAPAPLTVVRADGTVDNG